MTDKIKWYAKEKDEGRLHHNKNVEIVQLLVKFRHGIKSQKKKTLHMGVLSVKYQYKADKYCVIYNINMHKYL